MNKALLIALLVPAVALAGPKKKAKKKASPPSETTKPEASEPPASPDATPTSPATTPTPAKPGSTPAPPPAPAAGSTPAPTPAKPGNAPAAPAPSPAPPTGAGAGSAAGPATSEERPPAKDLDVDALRQEYLTLRDELFKSRARANAVASQLYSTRITIKFTWGSARHYGVGKASIRLDGATVFEDATGLIGNDDGVRFNGYVAPGRHLVTFHVEAAGKDDDSFTSATESQVAVKAIANKDLMVSAKGHDNGDIAYEWKRSEQGRYGLGIDVAVRSVASQGAKK